MHPKFDPKAIEAKWQDFWQKHRVHRFDPAKGPVFSINTPPPYPSGDWHAGNFLNWSYIDFIARYKRMAGFAVHFPQGWDVHGLPTETKVEKWKGKKSSEVPRGQWVEWCKEWTENYIAAMKEMIKRQGISCDWAMEYRTSDKDYTTLVQLSFLKLLESGQAYRGKHPVNWCTNDRTAIADAEIDYHTRRAKLYHLMFRLAGGMGEVAIATTRPELLCACVGIAVHPDDERYKSIAGRRVVVPLFGQEVEVFASDKVDPQFGSGVVMICTFGDKQDVEWCFRHSLPVIDAISGDGKMTVAAGKFAGMSTQEAKESIAKELEDKGLLLDTEEVEQNVGMCWRCKHPVEILNKEQWFVRTVEHKQKVIEETKKCMWWPEHMKHRQIDWTSSLSWDWVVSRQKVFGTPIPVWYCGKCGEIIPAEEGGLPVEPVEQKKSCPRCGSHARGETDTLDTWMDSSASNYFHAGWPKQGWQMFIPASLQPNGTDIIRTWDYYLMLRSLLLSGRRAYENILINGMVLGSDGRKMSKSLGNFVTATEIFEKTYADAVRYWAARSTPGSEVPFSWKEIQHAEKFYNKLWNITRFFEIAAEKITVPQDMPSLSTADKWLLSRLQRLIKECTDALESYTFPLVEIETFVWHELADFYVEMIKHRIYEGKSENESAQVALWTFYQALYATARLLAPFAPHIAEEIYQRICKKEGYESVHLAPWPKSDLRLLDENAERVGEMAADVISAVRKWKMERQLAQNAPLKELVVDKLALKQMEDDLKGTLKIAKISYGTAGELKTEKMQIGLRMIQ